MSRWTPTVHGTTFGGNPVSCAAALATIDVIREEGLLGNAKTNGKYLIERLRDIKAKHPMIGDVRGAGLMVGMEFVVPGTDREPDSAAAKKVLGECLSRGMLTYPCGHRSQTIRFSPPLNVTRDQIDEAVKILEQSISAI
jgi:4-aminobutyrate aminotransferase